MILLFVKICCPSFPLIFGIGFGFRFGQFLRYLYAFNFLSVVLEVMLTTNIRSAYSCLLRTIISFSFDDILPLFSCCVYASRDSQNGGKDVYIVLHLSARPRPMALAISVFKSFFGGVSNLCLNFLNCATRRGHP